MTPGTASEPVPPTVPTSVAVFVSGMPEATIRRAVERAEIRPLVRRRGKASIRLYRWEELVFLSLRQGTAELLARPARTALYRALQARRHSRSRAPVQLAEHLVVPIADVVEAVEQRLAAVAAAERWVETNPAIRGGEPVVRGTRVPVYELAALQRAGASAAALREHFPSVPREGLEAALAWAALHPKKGRPAMRGARWRRTPAAPA